MDRFRIWPFHKASECWRLGLVPAPIARFVSAPEPDPHSIRWFTPKRSFTFMADPFGMVDETGQTSIFYEFLDYRTKRGEIHYLMLDSHLQQTAQGVALRANHHLSYPYLISHQGSTYMLPEAHRSGALKLYRAERFPDRWVPVKPLLDLPAIDASPIFFQNRWWLFFALPGEGGRALRELHVAFADDLLGDWHLHPQNPVRSTIDSARMGGSPFVVDGQLYLPTQNNHPRYGTGLTLLRVDLLNESGIHLTPVQSLDAKALGLPGCDGWHTLSACGSFTLIDARQTTYSPQRIWIDWLRKLNRSKEAA
jgi:hypothetical protein